MTQNTSAAETKKPPKRVRTSGKRQHIFMRNVEFLQVTQYQKSKRLTFSAAACHLMMTGLRAEQMAQTSVPDALAFLVEAVTELTAHMDILRADIATDRSLSEANFAALQKTSAGAYLASRQLIAKLDSEGFARLDPMLKNYLNKIANEQDSVPSADDGQQTLTSRNLATL